MGRDKASIAAGRETLLERCAGILRPLVTTLIVVADSLARETPQACRIVTDLYPGAGPLGGIVTALTALEESCILVAACDMPFLRPELLNLLVDSAASEFDAVVPWIDGRPEPLCALYGRTCLPAFQTLLEKGERAAHRAIDAVRVRRVSEAELRAADPELISFVNLNTQDDVARWSNLL